LHQIGSKLPETPAEREHLAQCLDKPTEDTRMNADVRAACAPHSVRQRKYFDRRSGLAQESSNRTVLAEDDMRVHVID
jgi:hypothetical protein